MPLQLGDRNETVRRWRVVMAAMFGGTPDRPGLYARLHGPLPTNTDEFGARAQAWQEEYERRTGQVVDGIVSDQDLIDLKIVRPHRPIWCYSAPGSGVPWWVGPPFDLGEWCKNVLNLNHQPIGYPIGGYMGLMGGDPGLSYLDVIAALKAELRRLVATCPDLNDPNVEFWFFGYSQSADGIKRAVAELFGPGGEFARLRSRINGIIAFGDPTKPDTGIARLVWTAPDWVTALTHSITNQSPTPDFYAEAADRIRPLFYEWFIRAETELPFVIYTGQIIIPALLNLVAPFLGSLASPLALPILAGATGAPAAALAPIVGGVLGSNEKPNPELIKLLSVQGLLTSAPDLIAVLMAMPGIGVHGDYHAPKPEFGGRSGYQVGCDIVAGFRR
ncbi:hypothetical protein [Mycobacterium asiaticum]|uniref:Lysin B n=1 Tax=Mycobacterium asiaticum TaxID=1790 RepID=A0A1A3MYE2_MYCAS|nr:hypothetical protein [Mycobacterium asiaticum]OBK14100.1 hypothetical protein A5635_10430 [Mycobacterium asiaticum]